MVVEELWVHWLAIDDDGIAVMQAVAKTVNLDMLHKLLDDSARPRSADESERDQHKERPSLVTTRTLIIIIIIQTSTHPWRPLRAPQFSASHATGA
jgi:hypothetical protein